LAAGARANEAPAVGERLAAGRKKAGRVEKKLTRPEHTDDSTGCMGRQQGFVAPHVAALLALAVSVGAALVSVGARGL